MTARAQRFESLLAADRQAVWDVVSTPDGINAEFRPWLRMTFPADLGALTPETVPIGERLCRSWLLFLGFIPIDYDDVTLLSVDPPAGFAECSPMLTSREWRHTRTLEVVEGGCRVVDELAFEPRVGLMRPVIRRIVSAVFALRHRNLRRRFGVLAASDRGAPRGIDRVTAGGGSP